MQASKTNLEVENEQIRTSISSLKYCHEGNTSVRASKNQITVRCCGVTANHNNINIMKSSGSY